VRRSAVAAYEGYLGSPEGRLRCDLFWENLEPHLGLRTSRALDAGGGTGELAERLARRGLRVTLLDRSAEMRAAAVRRVGGLGVEIRAGDLAAAGSQGPFDLVCCHLALEYAERPRRALRALCRSVAPRGLLSLAFRNPAGEPLRLAAAGDAKGALAALQSDRFVAPRLGETGWLLRPDRVLRWLAAEGMRVVDSVGVRVLPGDIPAARALATVLERALGRREPFRAIARYLHVLARRRR
jgi:S-adenosylmethionine-dependent methyltransferase